MSDLEQIVVLDGTADGALTLEQLERVAPT